MRKPVQTLRRGGIEEHFKNRNRSSFFPILKTAIPLSRWEEGQEEILALPPWAKVPVAWSRACYGKAYPWMPAPNPEPGPAPALQPREWAGLLH